MKPTVFIPLLGLFHSGCFGISVAVNGGYTKGLTNEAPDATRLAAHLSVLRKPEKILDLPGPGHTYVLDRDAPCFYGFRGGLQGAFHKEVAMVGVSVDWFGYCKANKILGFTTNVGAKVFELGHSSGFSVGLVSPMAEVGVQFRLTEGLFLEGYGLGGLDVRIGNQKSYPYAGGGLRVSFGDLP